MVKRVIVAAVSSLLVSIAAMPSAQADIFTWVDASGAMTVSNLAPPAGARVTNVVHTNVAASEVARDAARAAQVQALSERVRQLEQDVEIAKNQPPVAMPYPPFTPPQPAPYAMNPPSFVQYPVEQPAPPSNAYGCDPTWAGCALSAPYWYPPAVFIVGSSNGRHSHGPRGGGHRFVPRHPMQVHMSSARMR